MKISEKKFIAFLFLMLFSISISFGQSGLSVHGYLTQAFAISTDHQIHGIPTEGTSDYRNLALQFRYDTNENQNIVIQFSHERLGLSPTMRFEQDVELDWAYFEYKFNDDFSMKIGKIQIPFGNYNEIRDVGTLLPFYRIPFAPYGEGDYMSETLDGVVFKYADDINDEWAFENKIMFGQWKWYEWRNAQNPIGKDYFTVYGISNVDNAYGFQTWIYTPIEDLVLGGGLMRGHVAGGLTFDEDLFLGEQNFYIAHLSLDESYAAFMLRADYSQFWLDDGKMNLQLYNIQTGYKFWDNIGFYLQTEYAEIFDGNVPPAERQSYGASIGDIDYYKNHSIALNYNVFTYLMIKFEYHLFEGYAIEDKFVKFYSDEPYKTQYAIFSVSTSF